jgi:hypothetical protein
MVESYDVRDGMTCFMHSSHGEVTMGHPFMPTVEVFKERAAVPSKC